MQSLIERESMQWALLRKVADLWRKLGELCDVFTPEEFLSYFRNAGYSKNNP